MPRIYGEDQDFDVSELTSYLSKEGTGNMNVLQQGSQEITNEFGATVLVRKYKCKRDLVDRFMPTEGCVDFHRKSLVYWDHEIDYEAAHAVFTVKFNGILDPTGAGRNLQKRVKKVEYDTQYQEITVENGTGAQVTLLYKSPLVKVDYVSRVRPSDDEKFAELPDGTARVVRINSAVVASLADIASTPVEAEEFYGLKSKLERPTFTRKQEGTLWMCTEVIHSIFGQQFVDFEA
jgi:hypothetical protein